MKTASKIYAALVFLFLYAPIIVLIIFSFNSSSSTSVFSGFSLRWYESLFQDKATLRAFYNTIILAVTSSVIATVLGTAAAVGINKYKKGFMRSSVMAVTNIPMMNPEIVTGISMMLLFVFVGRLVNSEAVLGFGTLLIAMSHSACLILSSPCCRSCVKRIKTLRRRRRISAADPLRRSSRSYCPR